MEGPHEDEGPGRRGKREKEAGRARKKRRKEGQKEGVSFLSSLSLSPFDPLSLLVLPHLPLRRSFPLRDTPLRASCWFSVARFRLNCCAPVGLGGDLLSGRNHVGLETPTPTPTPTPSVPYDCVVAKPSPTTQIHHRLKRGVAVQMGHENASTSTLTIGGMKLPVYLFTVCSRRYVLILATLILLLFFAFSDSFHVRSRVIDAAASAASLRPVDPLKSIANGTLGFAAIYAIALPDRHDKIDITSLAAAVTGLQLTWVDGVPGDKMNPKATPPIHFDEKYQDKYGEGLPNDGQVGCWRSHMNIWRDMVNNGVESALIIEDDADWDIRIVQQMQSFATATKEFLNKKEIRAPKNAASANMLDSPYGPDWEILYPGHCGGMVHPDATIRNSHTLIRNDSSTMPPSWDMHDLTIWLDRKQFLDTPCYTHAGRDAPGRTCDHPRIPADARVVQLGSPMCTMGYAISLKGARHFLANFGGVSLLDANNPVDQKLMEMCRGEHDHDDNKVRCVAVSPPYIESHRPRGVKSAESDIMPLGAEIREVGYSQGLVLSAKINIKNLVAGREPESQYVKDPGSNEWRHKRLDEYTEQ